MDSMFSNVPIFGLIVLFIGTVVAEAPYIVYWIATFFITFFIGMMFRVSGLKKIGIWTGLFLVLNIPPLVVPVYSYYQYSNFCETEAYYKINETIELGPEHWDEKGRSKFYPRDGLGFKSYKTEEDEFVLIRNSSSIIDALVVYRNSIVSVKDNRTILEYSMPLYNPKKFPDLSKIYRNLAIRNCSDLDERVRIPHLSDMLNEVFLLKGNNDE